MGNIHSIPAHIVAFVAGNLLMTAFVRLNAVPPVPLSPAEKELIASVAKALVRGGAPVDLQYLSVEGLSSVAEVLTDPVHEAAFRSLQRPVGKGGEGGGGNATTESSGAAGMSHLTSIKLVEELQRMRARGVGLLAPKGMSHAEQELVADVLQVTREARDANPNDVAAYGCQMAQGVAAVLSDPAKAATAERLRERDPDALTRMCAPPRAGAKWVQ